MRNYFFAALLLALVGCGKPEQAAAPTPAAPVDAEAAPAVPPPVAGAPQSAPTPVQSGKLVAAAPVVIANDETLVAYNKQLKAWIDSTSYLPKSAKELATLRGCPKPPQAPPGRVLVFDARTMSVHLE